MEFHAIYYTDDATDDGYRLVTAAGLQEAKAELRRQLETEGKTYRLDELIETNASFKARQKVREG